MSIWGFSYVINDREGSQGGGVSLQERGQKDHCTTHGFGTGAQAKLIRFFLDDKYVRRLEERDLLMFFSCLASFAVMIGQELNV